MCSRLGYSVYISNYRDSLPRLSEVFEPGSYIFTSFHISEEIDGCYIQQAKSMCHDLNKIGYRIIGDVSKKTLSQFGCPDLWTFADMMGISIIRIDYGFTDNEVIQTGKKVMIAINASTIRDATADTIIKCMPAYGIHNFYPRPETGLDDEFFMEANKKLQALGVKVMAFIPGDLRLREPLAEGLPTLEKHRYAAPFSAYIDLKITYRIDEICVGDGVISQYDTDRIRNFQNDGVLEIPVDFQNSFRHLYGASFTIRKDSPRWTKRLAESREYSCPGNENPSEHIKARKAGSITMDNDKYLRYSGEIQIVIEELPEDERVNVIGQIRNGYDLLLGNIRNGQKIRFVKAPALP